MRKQVLKSGKNPAHKSSTERQGLISVIMPVHNSEEHCVTSARSVLNQTYRNLELICVVDDSSDRSEQLLKELAQDDTRLVVVNNSVNNKGTGGARNYGVAHARGQYLSFIDDDDYLELDFLELLCSEIVAANVDMVQCGIRYIFENSSKNITYGNGVVLGEQCQLRIDVQDGQASIFPMVVAKLYKAQLFENMSQKSMRFEDIDFTPRLLKKVRAISIIDHVLYNYNKRYSSVTNWNNISETALAEYFEGIIQYNQSYFTPDLTEKRRYWNSDIPTTTYANINNLVRGINPLLHGKPLSYRNRFQNEYEECLLRLKDIVPLENQKIFFSKLVKPVYTKQSKNSILNKSRLIKKRIIKYNYKRRLVKFVEHFVPFFDRIIPKSSAIWVFSSWAYYPRHTLDNPRSIFESVKHNSNIKKVVIMHGAFNEETLVREGSNVTFLSVFSLQALYYQMRAGVFFTGNSLHRTFGYKKLGIHKDRKFVQLWHAITYKKIGLDVGVKLEPYWPNEVKKYSLFTSSSEFDRQTMIKSFSPLFPNKVMATGAPRHDLLLMEENQLPQDYKDQMSWLRDRKGEKKLFLYAPTWRSKNDESSEFSIEELKRLDFLCEKHGVLLGHRVHLIMRKNAKRSFFSNNFLNLDGLAETTILLREIDGLITDYSSLFFDVMQSKIPVILYHKDYESYSKTRGLPYTVEQSRPHKDAVDNFEKLYNKLDLMFSGRYELDEQYFEVRDRFLQFHDAKNSTRVLEALNLKEA